MDELNLTLKEMLNLNEEAASEIQSLVRSEEWTLIQKGHKKGKSLLIEDGALNWIVANSTAFLASMRQHIELALCHLAQMDTFLDGNILTVLERLTPSSAQ